MKNNNALRTASMLALLFLISLPTMAQRYVDKIDRGLVAVPSTSSGNFVSWRIFGEEYYDVTYNLYCNGSLIASGLEVSCYNHSAGSKSSQYQVAAVVRGVEQEKCEAITRWEYIDESAGLEIPVQEMVGRDGTNQNSHYALNDISLGDLTGDGIVEFIVKRPCDLVLDTSQSNCFNVLDAYDRFGNRLWWIDLGPNMISGPDEQWDCVCYDWDMDGKAEVLLRGADNMIIHHADGSTTEIGDMSVDTRNTVNTSNSNLSYTNTGNEYLLYLEGATGKPYQIGPDEHPDYMDYPNPRGSADDWGDDYGHRSTKHYFGAPYLDGRHPSIFLGRGCYTKHLMKAFDVDPSTHQLTQRWAWECAVSGSPWYGNGFHNFAIADVDWDGRDEIVFGNMIIDDSGVGLCTTGLGHGDAQHCSNFNPYRHGQQQFVCCEDNPNSCFYDATTGEILSRYVGTSDDGRALMGNFTNDYPGSVGRTVNTDWISSVNCKVNSNLNGDDFINWADLNQRIYWDGDLCDEYFDSPGTERAGAIYKPATSSASSNRWSFNSSQCANSSKNDPGAIADIFGDWREELVMRKSDNTAILVYTTQVPTTYRIPTLWHDHQYRNSIVWQSVGYNQPPHKSYFLGEMEGITVAPPPFIMTDRTEVANGGTITTTDDHLIVCETNDTKVTISDGASPYMVTFNVPSHVTGNAGSNTSSKPAPTYEYFTCDVTGGALTGSTRVVKQGDGILNLPKVDMTYTGETNIWAGTLNFDGTLKNSSLWLNRFAELNSDGGTFRSISADYAAIIRPGGADNKGSITTDTLALGFGSHVELDVYGSDLASDQINATVLTIETKTGSAWENYGPEYLTPVIDVVVHAADGETTLGDGSYVLGTVGTVVGDLSDIKIVGLAGQKTSLAIEDGKLVLVVVVSVRDPSTVYWTGEESSTWDFANAFNFNNDGEADYFVSGDDVIFDDAATSFTVSLADDLYPASVTVNSSKTYTFNGTGTLAGDMTLTKDGTGTLTIGNDNTYTGATTLSGGTLRVSSLSNSTQAYGNLGAVSTSPIVMEGGAVLQATAAVTNDTPIQCAGDDGGVLTSSYDFNMNGKLSGTLLEKKGSGWLKLYAANTSLTRMVISAGTVDAFDGAPASTVEFQGGSLYDDASNTSHAIEVPKGKTGTWYLTTVYYVAYANKLTGEGTLTIVPRNDVQRVRITGNWSNFYGTIKHTTSDIILPLDMSTSASHATLDIASGCEVSNTGKSLTIGAVTGKGALIQAVSNFQNQTTITNTTNTWRIGNSDGNDFTFEGKITDSGTNKCAFHKVGDCKMTFTGTGSFQGVARVNEGELVLNNSGSDGMLGTGTLTVASGGTLSGKGVLTNSATTVSAGGTLRSGINETSYSGDLQFSGSDITVNGTLQTYVASKNLYSKFSDIGKLTLNGKLTIVCKDGLELAEGTEIAFIDASSIVIGDDLECDLGEPNHTKGYTWDTSRLEEGILVVGSVPDAVKGIKDDTLGESEIYTLQGIKVPGTPKRAGIYIVDGVKTLLK